MSAINVLDFKTANLIAAGEVVERPASVVKELVENSIDAGAHRVTVEIRGGGVSMIRVTDDGCGMSAEDLPRCILRHATSKISTGDDLAAIGTLGFRGEALAATAAVSRMKIVSKMRHEATGHSINVTYGVCSTVSDAGYPDGTAVTVSELFSNVPARRKFLKQDKTEAAAVASVCEKLALSSPDVAFTFISDGVRRFATAGDGEFRNAVYSVFGRQTAAEMIPVNGTSGGITVTGGVASPVLARANRSMELFFINGRYVKSQVISSALEQALVSFIPAERFPCAVLFLSMHPSVVDVNVHPSKLEVKFSSDRPVFEAVYYAVKSCTQSGQRPELSPSAAEAHRPAVSPFLPVEDDPEKAREAAKTAQVTAFDHGYRAEDGTVRRDPERETPGFSLRSPSFGQAAEAEEVVSDSYGAPLRPDQLYSASEAEEPPREKAPEEWKFIGEAFDTYLFVESGDDVLIIDKHAAHERLRFETLKAAMKDHTASSQLRMLPISVRITEEEADAAETYREELEATGYGYETEDGHAEITQTPSNLDDREAEDLFVGMLAELSETGAEPGIAKQTLFERALYQVSCKGAIKGGDKNDREALEALIRDLFAHPDVTYCPHGRPVAFRMAKAAIERRFGRT